MEESHWKARDNRDSRLPMYKDKPYGVDHYDSAFNRKRKRKIVILAFLASFILYYIYQYGNTGNLWSLIPFGGTLASTFGSSVASEPRTWKQKQDAVKYAFRTSWRDYRKHAWGFDVYKPISKKGENMGPSPLGWMVVDALDTLHIMGLKTEFRQARRWVANTLDYDMDYEVNTFETTIRMLGGLLSAYYLTQDDLFLDKAVDLGNRLLPAFDTASGVPFASINLHTGIGKLSHADMGASSTAEAATLQLEFKYLANLTGESLYWTKAEEVIHVMDNNQPAAGLVPIFIQPSNGKYQGRYIRLGSRGDSYYEYLIKQYLQTSQEEPVYYEMYEEAVDGIQSYLVQKSMPNKLTFIGELENGVDGALSNKMDHLVCFAGGMFALGATMGRPLEEARKRIDWTQQKENEFLLGMEITRSCFEMYNQTETGLAPEIVVFNDDQGSDKDFIIKHSDLHNLQRPETVESLYILWKLTHNPIYREWGWKIFRAFEKYGQLPDHSAYTSLQNVNEIPPPRIDNLESFWFSETLKYLYLLFDDSEEEVFPLDKVVFNTEGHIFPTLKTSQKLHTGWSRHEPLQNTLSSEKSDYLE